MEENVNVGVDPVENNTADQSGTTPETLTEVEESTKTVSEKTPKTFTQEQVNNLIKERLQRAQKKFYDYYGVKGDEDLEDLLARSERYETLDEENKSLKDELSKLKEKNAFVENKIDPVRYDDVRAYFKGKGLNFSDEALRQELGTHPEWVKLAEIPKETTTIQTLGNDPSIKKVETEEEKINRVFGLNR